MLDPTKTAQYARALYQAHGDRAEAEAAQNARQAKAAGDTDKADDWSRVRRAIREIRGPRVA